MSEKKLIITAAVLFVGVLSLLFINNMDLLKNLEIKKNKQAQEISTLKEKRFKHDKQGFYRGPPTLPDTTR